MIRCQLCDRPVASYSPRCFDCGRAVDLHAAQLEAEAQRVEFAMNAIIRRIVNERIKGEWHGDSKHECCCELCDEAHRLQRKLDAAKREVSAYARAKSEPANEINF